MHCLPNHWFRFEFHILTMLRSYTTWRRQPHWWSPVSHNSWYHALYNPLSYWTLDSAIWLALAIKTWCKQTLDEHLNVENCLEMLFLEASNHAINKLWMDYWVIRCQVECLWRMRRNLVYSSSSTAPTLKKPGKWPQVYHWKNHQLSPGNRQNYEK